MGFLVLLRNRFVRSLVVRLVGRWHGDAARAWAVERMGALRAGDAEGEEDEDAWIKGLLVQAKGVVDSSTAGPAIDLFPDVGFAPEDDQQVQHAVKEAHGSDKPVVCLPAHWPQHRSHDELLDDLLLLQHQGTLRDSEDATVKVLRLACSSHSDRARFEAVKVLLLQLTTPSSMSLSDAAVATEGSALYSAFSDAQMWLKAIEPFTFRSEVRELTRREVAALQSGEVDDDEDDDLAQLRTWIDAAITTQFAGQAFVKLSTRSPKDAVFDLPEYDSWYQAALAQGHTASTAQHLAARHGLVVTNAAEALRLLARSKRIQWDFAETMALDLYDRFTDLHVVLREWRGGPTMIDSEIRAFVCGRKLTALSQTFATCYFPWVSEAQWRERMTRVRDLFLDQSNGLREALPMDDCVLDCAVLDGDRVHVIEVNAFGAVLGGTLFGWETDQDVLYHGPLTGRFVCSPSLAVTTLIDL